MKHLILIALLAIIPSQVVAQQKSWQPPAGLTQISIWPGRPPDSKPLPGAEFVERGESLVGGKPWFAINRVSQPTMTVYPPKGTNSGVAVVVFPGGGYRILAIDLEGTEVCDWLTSKGITCVLLKYRVPGSKGYAKGYPKSGPYPNSPMALQDAQRSIGLVRSRAAEWQIDPHKIGVLGFSAGGHLAAAVSTHFDKRLYEPVDEADKESCRPDFSVVLYPGHLWNWNYLSHPKFELNPDVPVTSQTTPTILIQAEDDPIDDVNNSRVYYAALQRAGVLSEMHLFPKGGHAFGLRRTKFPVTDWPKMLLSWLEKIGIVQPTQ